MHTVATMFDKDLKTCTEFTSRQKSDFSANTRSLYSGRIVVEEKSPNIFAARYSERTLIPIYQGTGAAFTKAQLEYKHELNYLFESIDSLIAVISPHIVLSTTTQIEKLKNNMGLNMSEVASIMNVSRPAIYSWLDHDARLRPEHQQRLNEFSEMCLYWEKKGVGRLGSYLRKHINHKNETLLFLLKKEKLDMKEICNALDEIAKTLKSKKDKLSSHAATLMQHGFEELSEEKRNENLNKITRKIG